MPLLVSKHGLYECTVTVRVDGVRLCLCTEAHNGPFIPAPDVIQA
jgi:hypothetical protein